MTELQVIIEAAFERRHEFTPTCSEQQVRDAVKQTLTLLSQGQLRVAEKFAGEWVVHQWVKKAILLSAPLNDTLRADDSSRRHLDNTPTTFANHSHQSAYIAPNTSIQPSFVDAGAYIDEHTQFGAWSSVGSCAQIGKNVHLASGVIIGGMLEPLQATPTIIEDSCYIGSRSVIEDGVVVEQGCVISSGVVISQSTRIFNRETNEIYHGRVPAGSVVVPGSLLAPCSKYSLDAAIIVKTVDAETKAKVGISALLRLAV
ncbi:2,3,4,5-tetrahydropyridine-2,6-dicarboxylate N-succinyltransferase [Neiella marina]|uniref:2,3,4,5-tetrahydropyridine-2,6-dicarboxylate N-succinyltransferase n=1 Tax=Neiella holothuriorum TaxID=2870530 RepID=A0ABS7EG46_9GAMM|nr:2,3,4,5-tetrahydropyridine-2,6-dicarboxylate N-succinyltransferase [Neiella holothuriorum]MBW8190898.1 2,3,4,5-tetrahydropyridine-2,6-dicarboxylate N-succinyltransferase [Neiella holothuriorum]